MRDAWRVLPGLIALALLMAPAGGVPAVAAAGGELTVTYYYMPG